MSRKISVTFMAALLGCALPAWSQEMPEGPGKDLVMNNCNSCHAFMNNARNGYTPEGWATVMRMMTNHGVALTPEQVATMTEYVSKNFPEKAKPAGVVLPGPVKVTMKTWPVPTPGSRPHDPLATRDGAFWYTGQMTGVLGRLDPKTGAWKEYPLKTAHSGPHGLTEDSYGNIWYTGNRAGLIGKLDPKTGAVTEYPVPNDGPTDTHTLIFDKSGTLWFTAQNANKIGRVDPKTGEMKLVSPSPKSRPYGMAFDPQGTLFVVLFGTNRIAAVDTKTMAIREFTLPDEKARPRRLAITSDGIVWYADYARGYLGRLDPATSKVTEWASPSGPNSAPYGMSVIDDVVWYSESGSKPNTVVRFDPKTAKFQSWAIPGGGYIVRNTSVTPDGNFLLANSLTNGVTLVTIQK